MNESDPSPKGRALQQKNYKRNYPRLPPRSAREFRSVRLRRRAPFSLRSRFAMQRSRTKEKRMDIERLRFIFGMELARDEIRMNVAAELDHFNDFHRETPLKRVLLSLERA